MSGELYERYCEGLELALNDFVDVAEAILMHDEGIGAPGAKALILAIEQARKALSDK